MTDFILHHYPSSPFSEKIRLIFGAKQLAWKSVIIPAIMPKPDVLALTGGYRKTPIMQIGADIYCDSALIAKKIDQVAPTPTLYPTQQAMVALSLSQWADTALFQGAVAHVFKPANLAHMFGNSPATLEAFMKDRQAMRANATTRRLSSLEALATVKTFLSDFDRQLEAGVSFAAGSALSVADFSIYHCLWFMRRAQSAAKLLEPYRHVADWMQRIASHGHGTVTEIESSEAVAIANRSKPSVATSLLADTDLQVGDPVAVLPTDYGIDPTPGTLLACSADEIVIERSDARAGKVAVHFPRMNYELRKAE